MTTGIVWFRNDLRLSDNPAWAAATTDHDHVVALFVVDPCLWRSAGTNRRNQLASHLEALDRSIMLRGGRLRVEYGDPIDVVPAMGSTFDAHAIHVNADVTPYAVRRDEAVAASPGPVWAAHGGRWVHPPGSILTGQGGVYQVFTPFHRRWAETPWSPWPEPTEARIDADPGAGVPLADAPLMAGGEEPAWERLEEAAQRADRYGSERDRPDLDSTTRLSADLKFGTLAARRVMSVIGDGSDGRRQIQRQIAWRDFYGHLMQIHPDMAQRSMRPVYDRIEWRHDPDGLSAWSAGLTGYPIVDAGMRQLMGEGRMHNRVRMITASFLVKDLLIDWRLGERHFRRLLVDGDIAQNAGNWQWVAGTGADAAPYFRVFNPVSQSRKFDPDGEYIRRWIPELGRLETRWIHAPWEAGPLDLAASGVTLGETYPEPIVDHAVARGLAIAAYTAARS